MPDKHEIASASGTVEDDLEKGAKTCPPLIQITPNSYHVFEMEGYMMLYDVGTSSIIEIEDRIVFDILSLSENMDMEDAKSRFLLEHPDVDDKVFDQTLEQFTNIGFFEGGGKIVHPEKTMDRAIDRLMRHQPRRIQLFVAQACNLACIYCYAEENGSNARDEMMSIELAKKAVDYLVEKSGRRKVLTVMFFGGEPLMNFEVMRETVAYTKEIAAKTGKMFKYQISTNGTLLTKEIQDFIVSHKMGTLVSIDGDKETHDAQRPFRDGKGSFDIVLANALSLDKKFREHGMLFKARANFTSKVKNIPDINDKMQSLGFDYVGISSIFDRPDQDTEFAFNENEKVEVVEAGHKRLLDWLDRLDADGSSAANEQSLVKKIVACNMEALGKPRALASIGCGVGRNTNAVDVDGNIFPCHRFVGMKPYILGNIKTGMDSDKLRKYYEDLMKRRFEKCVSCWARLHCTAPCAWEAARADGTIDQPSDKYCDGVRMGVSRNMYTYARLAKKHPDYLKKLMNYRTSLAQDFETCGEEEKENADSREKTLTNPSNGVVGNANEHQ